MHPTVVIFLGPYRNLTTLWSAVLSMHPSVVSVNHITPELEACVPDIVDAKVEYPNLVQLLLDAVGEETKPLEDSHALRHADDAFRDTYFQWQSRKLDPTHILWKDSGRLTAAFWKRKQQGKASLRLFVEAYPQVKFVMPLRNPVDMVRSNMEKSSYLKAYQLPSDGYICFIDWYLEILQWFLRWKDREPSRFQHLMTPSQRLLDWLELPPVEDYLPALEDSFQIRPPEYGFRWARSGIRSYLKHRMRIVLHHYLETDPECTFYQAGLELLRQVLQEAED